MVDCYTVNLFTYVLIIYLVNNKGKCTHKIQLKTTTASHLVFTWVSPEVDPEINTKGIFHRKSWNISKGRGCKIRQKVKKGIVMKQFTTLENWSLCPLGSSGSPCKHTHMGNVTSKGHQFPLDIGLELYPEGVHALAYMDYCMWAARRD